uniref:Mediator complex subunit 22 n=1 Tax=Pan troglodytes TaxID=9598 RepID=K7CJL8_PANTR
MQSGSLPTWAWPAGKAAFCFFKFLLVLAVEPCLGFRAELLARAFDRQTIHIHMPGPWAFPTVRCDENHRTHASWIGQVWRREAPGCIPRRPSSESLPPRAVRSGAVLLLLASESICRDFSQAWASLFWAVRSTPMSRAPGMQFHVDVTKPQCGGRDSHGNVGDEAQAGNGLESHWSSNL